MSDQSSSAFFSLTQAEYAAGEWITIYCFHSQHAYSSSTMTYLGSISHTDIVNTCFIGNFRGKVLESNMTASVRVVSRTDNVAGVKLPVFSQYETGAEQPENLGLVGGGRKITACREKFGEYLKALIKLASLQTSFLAMDEALKITNRRVNALENVTLPKITTIIDYINRCVLHSLVSHSLFTRWTHIGVILFIIFYYLILCQLNQ